MSADTYCNDIGTDVDGPVAFGAGSHHGQPSGGDVAGDPTSTSAACRLHVLIDSTGLQV